MHEENLYCDRVPLKNISTMKKYWVILLSTFLAVLLTSCQGSNFSEEDDLIGVRIKAVELNGKELDDGDDIKISVDEEDVENADTYVLTFEFGSNTTEVEVDVDGEKEYTVDADDKVKIFKDITLKSKTYEITITPLNEDGKKGESYTIEVKVTVKEKDDDSSSSEKDSSSSEKESSSSEEDSSSSEEESSSSEEDSSSSEEESSSSEEDSSSSEEESSSSEEDSSSSEEDSSSSEEDSSSSEEESSSSEEDSSSSEEESSSSVEDGQLYPIEFTDGVVFNGSRGLSIETEKSEATLEGNKLVVTWDKGSDPRGEPIPNSFMFDFGKITDVSQYKSIKFKYTSEVPVKMWLVWGASISGSTIYQYDVKPGGGADYYFLPSGLNEEIELSLAGNFHNGQVINGLENLDVTKLRHIGFKTHYDYTPTIQGGETITFEDFRFEEEEVFQEFQKKDFSHPSKGYVWIGQENNGITKFFNTSNYVRPSGIMGYFSMWQWNYGWDTEAESDGEGDFLNLRKWVDNPAYDKMSYQIAIGLWLNGHADGCAKVHQNWKMDWNTDYDEYVQLHLDLLSDRIKQMKAPVFLRLNHEFNNYSAHGCGTEADLGKAIKTFGDYFHMRGVKNVEFVIHKWGFRGDAYNLVDDVLNAGAEKYVSWIGGTTFNINVDVNAMEQNANQRNKKTMIAEAMNLDGFGNIINNGTDGFSFIYANTVLGGVGFNTYGLIDGDGGQNWNNNMNNSKILKESDMKFTYSEMGGIDMNW